MKLFFQISNNFIFLSKQNLDMLDVLNWIILKNKKRFHLFQKPKFLTHPSIIFMKCHRLLKNKDKHAKGNVTV